MDNLHSAPEIAIHGARYAASAQEAARGTLEIAGGRICSIAENSISAAHEIYLDGFLLLPGLINAHDHLQYALYPRLGNPPYKNYIEWGEDIHATLAETIARQKLVPRDVRLWWGGIRNLLCGVTTVCHHNVLWPTLLDRNYPIKVVRRYGWSHSLALGEDLHKAHTDTPADTPFIVHTCEGVDEQAREEIFGLDRLGVLDERTVLVHGLALDESGIALARERKASLILCPSSNDFLFQQVPDSKLLHSLNHVALGSDSPLTSAGDLLDEVQFLMRHSRATPEQAYRMVTEIPAQILRLTEAAGKIQRSASADLIAVRDTSESPKNRLSTLSWKDVELVMVAGQIQLASHTLWTCLPALLKQGMEPLWIDGAIRWLRAPIHRLLQRAEAALGIGSVRLSGRLVATGEGGSL